ncbi:hypothetical protein [Desertimonas flava]|jgi:hypothetical protein|uniref:hypothetical protein n=1 Tax=Desertimonas flava TaxID=2064846 RepID=UPI000E34AC83|nr:hypothetical protein [Desertimonas flava]
MSKGSSAPITRDDLEQGFAAVQTGLKGKVEDRKNTLVTVATVAGVVLLLLVFFFGRRSGRRKTTFVEIRRV